MHCTKAIVNYPAFFFKVKRMGGAFGGKESRNNPAFMAAALAAEKHGLPVRMCLDRDEDMVMMGQRHPFLTNYKVAFSNEGHLKAIDVDYYCNAGHTLDLSFSGKKY
jgi:xanthine dehydrogenase/oxidase